MSSFERPATAEKAARCGRKSNGAGLDKLGMIAPLVSERGVRAAFKMALRSKNMVEACLFAKKVIGKCRSGNSRGCSNKFIYFLYPEAIAVLFYSHRSKSIRNPCHNMRNSTVRTSSLDPKSVFRACQRAMRKRCLAPFGSILWS